MESIKEKFESIENFKKDFTQKVKEISYDDFERDFYVENYFLSNKIPYIEKRFDETVLEIVANIVKNCLQELEYYVNVKPSSPLAQSDCEVLSKEEKILKKYYFKFHILYKKYHEIHLLKEENTQKSLDYLKENYDTVNDFIAYSAKLQTKLIKNIEKHIEELDKDEKKYESSVFN